MSCSIELQFPFGVTVVLFLSMSYRELAGKKKKAKMKIFYYLKSLYYYLIILNYYYIIVILKLFFITLPILKMCCFKNTSAENIFIWILPFIHPPNFFQRSQEESKMCLLLSALLSRLKLWNESGEKSYFSILWTNGRNVEFSNSIEKIVTSIS